MTSCLGGMELAERNKSQPPSWLALPADRWIRQPKGTSALYRSQLKKQVDLISALKRAEKEALQSARGLSLSSELISANIKVEDIYYEAFKLLDSNIEPEFNHIYDVYILLKAPLKH